MDFGPLSNLIQHNSHTEVAKSGVEWGRQGSNLRPRDYESPALTTELRPHGAEDVRDGPDRWGPGKALVEDHV